MTVITMTKTMIDDDGVYDDKHIMQLSTYDIVNTLHAHKCKEK